MLCPKCGKEYEGNRCLSCEGPEIIINNEDYLRRKKAYEEKQAGNKSAFSDNKTLEGKTSKEKVLFKESFVDNEQATLTPEDIIGKVKRMGEAIGKRAEELGGRQVKKSDFLNKKSVFTALLCLVILVVVLIVVFIPKSEKTTLYATDADKLYAMKNKEFVEACDFKRAIFTADEKEYYTPSIPDVISNLHIVKSVAAKKGKYFSTVAYEESEKMYSLYIWNEENCSRIISTASEIKLINISENGFVTYTLTEVVNDEGNTGSTSAYIFKTKEKKGDIFADSSIVTLAENVVTAFVYDSLDAILCYTKNDELYIYTEVKDGFNKSIKSQIDCVYAWKDDVYTYYADSVNFSENAKGFIYSMAGECYYHDLSDNKAKAVYVGNASGAENRFVYVADKYVYVFNHTNIKYSKLGGDIRANLQVIAMLNKNTDVCYIGKEKLLYYIDENQSLSAIVNGEVMKIDDSIEVTSLDTVINDKGIIYVKNGERFYKPAFGKGAVKIGKESDLSANGVVVYYDGYIYFTTAEGMLDRCKRDGSDYTSLGRYDLIR